MRINSMCVKVPANKIGRPSMRIAFAVLLLLFAAPSIAFADDASICAHVKMEIDQQMTLERQAFDAHLQITDGLTNISLTNVNVSITFTDANGNSVRGTTDLAASARRS